MFRIGQKVVCVDDSINPYAKGYAKLSYLNAGEVYTITEISETWQGVPAAFLRETKYHGGFPFQLFRFRPLVSSSTKESRQAIIDKMKTIKQLVFYNA